MYVIRWAAAAAFCAFCVTSNAAAQQVPAPPAAAKYERVWPVVLPDPKAGEAQPQVEWSKQDIELAQARCTALLKGLDVVAMPDAPLREQDDCGTPAPMRLVSIGSHPQVAFSPPPTLTCDMIAALHKWLQRDVQPLARKHLGAPVVTITTMSSYSCRNAYGRSRGRLSEHGRANALDISGFATARGQATLVLADWGPIAREIAAQAAAAQKQREATAPRNTPQATPQGPTPPVVVTAPVPGPAQHTLRPSIAIELPGISLQRPEAPAALGLTQPNRLGGPKQNDDGSTPAEPLAAKAQFLRAAHRGACQIFGTVLGPEANNWHKNHFHLDMAERRHAVICD
jgi:hypothetical protein